MRDTTLIRGAQLPDGTTGDVAVAAGRIVEPAALGTPDAVVDAAGLIALPGFVDMHTHLREPGREDAETVLTGSQSAAAGGFTAVHAMANTSPVADTAGVVEQVFRLGLAAGYTEVRPVGAVTVGLAGSQLAELGAMADSQAAVRVFSDDGHCVHDPLVMRRALEYVKSFDGIIAQHAQEPRLTEGAQMNEGAVSAELGLPGWPAVAEESIIARDVLLAEHVGSRLHVCHVSTAGSVDLIRWAKSRGIRVTAEVTPHHLVLTDERVRSFDPVFKVNPPLRRAEDVEALRAGLLDGTIDVIGTDHAPHPAEHKCAEWTAAAMGMVGMETAAAVVLEAMRDTEFSFADLARVMSTRPAEITGLSAHGSLAVGAPANLVLLDPDAPHTVEPAAHLTKGRNNPFGGTTLHARITDTFLYGRRVLAEGALAAPRPESGAAAWSV
ncbi:dihydroorotase [Brevibacterium album]|uniref:dihydroorotase n=1 Tax=Brevibacterium album TaxID=417948 RepID=UPI0004104DF5|nr:dihydroorotase [Brevibacterium album]